MQSRLHAPLLAWFDAHRRALPWRGTRDPYAVWVSEIMLQQTQVATVIPYYEAWMVRFPTVAALAQAGEQQVLSLWQGLGYYRRCKLLLAGARHVAELGAPVTAAGWLKVPGVGRYTAGAIASIAFGEAVPVVDGNVERVFARLTGCPSSGPALHRAAWSWASDEVHNLRPGDWNQALMELGATICRPSKPLCTNCPLASNCRALSEGLQEALPKVERKPSPILLRHRVSVPYHDGRFGVRQIPEGQWWAGMWEFPREDLADRRRYDRGGEGLGTIRHTVTKHRITVDASLARVRSASAELRWLTAEELLGVPMPAAQRRILGLALARLSEGGFL